MITKFKILIALFILISAFSGGVNANAGLFDWATSRNTEWIFGNIYDNVSKKSDNPTNPVLERDPRETGSPSIQKTVVLESKNPVTPVRTKTAPVIEYTVIATAYSSTVDQTDDTPFITASGTYVRDGIAAANFLPFGTVFKIPDLYGDKIFIVEDRMNKRYWRRVDIWFPERQTAKEFGIKKVTIEIVS